MRTTNISTTLCWISVAFNWPGDVYYVTVFCSVEPQIFGVYHEKSWKQKSHSFDIKNLFWKHYTSQWIILKRLRATTVIRSRDIHVANYDLSVSSQNRLEIHSHDIVFCRLETDNCLLFLLRRELILSCWPMMIVKRYLFVNELASSRAKTVSVTTATTWCGTLNESKSVWSLWQDTLYRCPVQNWKSIKT